MSTPMLPAMPSNPKLKEGEFCQVLGGTHAGKSGTVHDIKTSKTGHITITVKQKNGERFKTLARNVEVQPGAAAKRTK